MRSLTIAALSLGSLVAPLHAEETVFANQDAVTDRVEAVEDRVQDDFREAGKTRRFGPGYGHKGWYGSVSATASATSGNTDTLDLGIGSKFGHFDGLNGHDVALSYQYGEDSGTKTDNALAFSYEYSRYFNGDFYGFGKLATVRDDFASYTEDHFAGIGLGYRVVNNQTTTWSLQAGPGYRVQESAAGVRTESAAWSLGSKFYTQLSDNAFLTNDTSVIGSDNDTLVVNDLGVNMYLAGPLALRTSLVSTYHSDPIPGLEDTDHKLGLSLVYTFR